MSSADFRVPNLSIDAEARSLYGVIPEQQWFCWSWVTVAKCQVQSRLVISEQPDGT